MIVATCAEWRFVPRQWGGAQHLTKRLLFIILVFIINLAPAVYVFLIDKNNGGKIAHILGIVQFFVALITFFFFSVMPLGGLFGSYLTKNTRRYVASQTFTASYPRLHGNDMWMSYGLWVLVFTAKFAESYYFLTLSIRDPIRILSVMHIDNCIGDNIIGKKYAGANMLCKKQPQIILGIMYFTDIILFFLDTYLWYILLNTVFSVARSFYLGVSIWTPWRNIFSRLPKRIYSKILATTDMEIKYKPKVLISQIWNAVVISMYREHLLAIDHVQKLLYHQVRFPASYVLPSLTICRFHPNKKENGLSVHLHSSFLRKIILSRPNSSPVAAKLSVVSHFSPSLCQPRFRNRFLWITCRPLLC
jgi:1,3-beta-glucan synthase